MAVRKRTDRNTWESYVVLDGKRYRKSFPTKKEALAYERDLIVRHARGELVVEDDPSPDVTFREFAETYLEYATATKAPKTVYDERCALNAHLVPFFGDMTLGDIQTADVERFKLKRLREKPKNRNGRISHRTINLNLTLISVMFELAKKLGYVTENPVDGVEKLRKEKRPPQYLKEREVKRFIEASRQTYLYTMMVCALTTGMRKSELCNLQWDDIDFDANAVTIRSKDDWKTKNRDYRTLEMTEVLREAFLTEYERRLPDQPYVFTWQGKPLKGDVRKTLERIARIAETKAPTLHQLRHTFASHLAMAGVPIRHIQELMGHRDIQTTMVYAHISEESKKGMVHRLPFARRNDEEES